MEAIRYNEPDIVKVLLEFGADAYKQDDSVSGIALPLFACVLMGFLLIPKTSSLILEP